MKSYLDTIDYKDSGSYILVGDRESIEKDIVERYRTKSSVLIYNEKLLDIATVRDIIAEHSLKSIKKRYFILSFFSISIPAQNALLKLFEEPGFKVVFCIITSDKQKLLPTILSRATLIEVGSTDTATSKKILDLLSKDSCLRLEDTYVKKLLALKDKDEKVDRELISMFIQELVKAAYIKEKDLQSKQTAAENNTNAIVYDRILETNRYASYSGTSLKILAEYALLTLPKYQL